MPSYNSLANLLFNEINTYMVTPSGEFSTVLEQKKRSQIITKKK